MQTSDKNPNLAVLLLLLPISILLNAYVLTCLWGWFVVPFFNLPILEIVNAAGLLTIVSFLRANIKQQLSTSDIIVAVFAKPLMFLGIGFVISLFM